MKKIFAIVIAVLLTVSAAALAEDARGVMDMFAAGDYQGIYDLSAPSLKDALGGRDALGTAWEQITQLLGGYIGITGEEQTEQSGYVINTLACDFEKATATLVVTFDSDGLMAGFQITGYEYKKEETAGPWTEEEITLRPGAEDETAGRLTLPEGEGPFPCVIMMQGSGASDMDETAYGFGVFSELAHALARRGVASLRYDKYTFAHPELCAGADFGIYGEYTADAAEALAIAGADSRLADIYLLGHSEGAMVAPRVAAELGGFSGLILLEGSPLPLWRILARQLGDESLITAFEGMRDMSEEELKTQTFMGAYYYYWFDQANYDYAGAIIDSGARVFISQGGKDFQVLPEEGADAWRAALGDYKGVTYRDYPDMTHLLFDLAGESAGNANDYAQPGELDPALADDIAAWICE